MLIALDYDGTYTLDPVFWDSFIKTANESGHEVICATMRHESEKIPLSIKTIYTGRNTKLPFLHSLGIKPDVWIDDNPYFIVACNG